jgi:hypothetical protein
MLAEPGVGVIECRFPRPENRRCWARIVVSADPMDAESTYRSENLATAGEAMTYNMAVSGAAAHHAAGPTAVLG